MSQSFISMYGADPHVAEIYDQHETALADVDLIRGLIEIPGDIRILEPFCGTGRILIPLALEGHTVVGMDQSAGMLRRACHKIQELPLHIQARITLIQTDVLSTEWPRGLDLVILGCNCFYELATPEEQETCILQAFQSLKPGGHLFLDNDHMEGDLSPSWQDIGVVHVSLAGACSDGTIVECTRETVWFDAAHRLARFRRRTKITSPEGNVSEQEFIQQKHPVSKGEVQSWLDKNGFIIENILGSHHGLPYSDVSPRAIFWARRN